MSEFIFEFFFGFDFVGFYGHAIIDDHRSVCGVHDDVSFRQVEMRDVARIQYFDALCQTGVYVEYLIVITALTKSGNFLLCLKILVERLSFDVFCHCGEVGWITASTCFLEQVTFVDVVVGYLF